MADPPDYQIAVWRDILGRRGTLLGVCWHSPGEGWRFFPNIKGRRVGRARPSWEETLPGWTGGLDGTRSARVRHLKGKMTEIDNTARD
ncbi:hypothetical protein [uncultured Alsobacter sp.]|uniref:hypothetical protein n=1 Tax=uncultured Alsobacter sp. TaxID=1748258 RepID=UPI0025F5CFE7|nr:hypothetical protein [uncultured Alsobacter sp.]